MKFRNYLALTFGLYFSISILLSCRGLNNVDDPEIQFYGVWVKETTTLETTIFRRAAKLDEHEYGFIIYSNGNFLERKNAGWCATPPISYANYEGNWQEVSDDVIEITVGYWGGTTTYRMEIVSLGKHKLQIKYQ